MNRELRHNRHEPQVNNLPENSDLPAATAQRQSEVHPDLKGQISPQKTTASCAKCGACTSVCPIYQITGQEHLTARGRMHLLSSLTSPAASKQSLEIFSKCLLCGACRASCPRGLNIPDVIIKARHRLPQITGFPSFKKYLIRKTVATPFLLRLFAKIGSKLGLLPKELPAASGLHLRMAGQKTPPTAQRSFDRSPYHSAEKHEKKVLYFTGCLANYLDTEIAHATCLLLDRLCKVQPITVTPHCCGMAAFAAGDLIQARELAKKNITLFSAAPHARLPIVTSCATCFSHLANYAALFDGDPEWRERAAAFSARVCEFSRFMLTHGRDNQHLLRNTSEPSTVIYHDPCHLRFHRSANNRPDPITSEPRELLGWLAHTTLLEPPHGPRCCGQGGLFHLSHPDLAATLSQNALDALAGLTPEYLLTSCSGCLVQWRQVLSQAHHPTQAEHLAPFLARHLPHR